MRVLIGISVAMVLAVAQEPVAYALGGDSSIANANTSDSGLPEDDPAPGRGNRLLSEAQINAQILCLKKARTGTRIATRRCQSVAAWKSEIAAEHIKRYLLEM